MCALTSGEFTKGYVFHGDPERVFKEFFGGDNPFAGKVSSSSCVAYKMQWISKGNTAIEVHCFGYYAQIEKNRIKSD